MKTLFLFFIVCAINLLHTPNTEAVKKLGEFTKAHADNIIPADSNSCEAIYVRKYPQEKITVVSCYKEGTLNSVEIIEHVTDSINIVWRIFIEKSQDNVYASVPARKLDPNENREQVVLCNKIVYKLNATDDLPAPKHHKKKH